MKGSMLDLPVIISLLLGGAMTILLVFFVVSEITNNFPATETDALYVLQKGVSAVNVFDYMFVFFAVGLGMFSVISAFFIDSHPIFFILSVIILIPIVILTSAQMTNAFDAFISTSVFSSVANSFPYTVLLMRNLPLFCLILGILVAIVMHGKSGGI